MTDLLAAVAERQRWVQDYLFAQDLALPHPHLNDAVYHYLQAGGKSLRPAVLMFACGVVGGDERTALPAAAAVELYHTFSLVHDDIIDNDDLRRGQTTVHVEFTRRAQQEMGYPTPAAQHYGLSLAILAGDMQQGWAVANLPRLHHDFGLPAELALNLVAELFGRVQNLLIAGETLDIVYAQTPPEDLTPAQVIDMLWRKTGALYEFAGRAGAAIGLREPNLYAPEVERVAAFASKCGTAFQIQDDILGIVADEAKLGKPVGSDIREGKRTLIVLESLQHLDEAQRQRLLTTLGNPHASPDAIRDAIDLLRQGGGIETAQHMAQTMIEDALALLEPLADSEYKALLMAWARYMIERRF